MDGIDLEFTDDALRAIAQKAMERKTGARGLRAIIEDIMLDVMYEIPSRDDIAKCVITREVVTQRKEPILVSRERKRKKEETA